MGDERLCCFPPCEAVLLGWEEQKASGLYPWALGLTLAGEALRPMDPNLSQDSPRWKGPTGLIESIPLSTGVVQVKLL